MSKRWFVFVAILCIILSTMPVNGISPNGEVHLNNNGSEVVVVLDYVWSSEEWGALESNGLFP